MEITLPNQVTSQQHSGNSGFGTGTETKASRATWMHEGAVYTVPVSLGSAA